MSRQMSRREVLIGGAALGIGGALGAAGIVAGTRPAVAAATGSPMIGVARVGATFDLFPFCPGTTYPEAVDIWNRTTGTSMRCWKVYYKLSEFPRSIDDRIGTIIARGIQALVSFKPAIPPSAAALQDLGSLRSALEMFSSAGLIAEVCLWQEVGPKDMTAAEYHRVVQYYGPTVRRHYPLVFDGPGYPGDAVYTAYDPGRDQLDGYAVDYYCGDFVHGRFHLETLTELAGDLPVGIWEIGNTASDSFLPTPTQVTAYMNHMQSFLTQRAASGLPVGSVAWYNGPADPSQSGQNEVAGCHPCALAPTDIVAYRKLYDAVNAVP